MSVRAHLNGRKLAKKNLTTVPSITACEWLILVVQVAAPYPANNTHNPYPPKDKPDAWRLTRAPIRQPQPPKNRTMAERLAAAQREAREHAELAAHAAATPSIGREYGEAPGPNPDPQWGELGAVIGIAPPVPADDRARVMPDIVQNANQSVSGRRDTTMDATNDVVRRALAALAAPRPPPPPAKRYEVEAKEEVVRIGVNVIWNRGTKEEIGSIVPFCCCLA